MEKRKREKEKREELEGWGGEGEGGEKGERVVGEREERWRVREKGGREGKLSSPSQLSFGWGSSSWPLKNRPRSSPSPFLSRWTTNRTSSSSLGMYSRGMGRGLRDFSRKTKGRRECCPRSALALSPLPSPLEQTSDASFPVRLSDPPGFRSERRCCQFSFPGSSFRKIGSLSRICEGENSERTTRRFPRREDGLRDAERKAQRWETSPRQSERRARLIRCPGS